MESADFDLNAFLPYLLNQAAERASAGFQQVYKTRYGMTRTQWRVLANIAQFGAMRAREICERGHLDKTKVSRAVKALSEKGYLARARSPQDRRAEILSLTAEGRDVFDILSQSAIAFERDLQARFGQEDAARLSALLARMCEMSFPLPHEDQ